MSTSTEQNTISAPSPKGRRRWIKVDVDDELFAHLHIRAAESRMRFLPYLRRFLVEARSYPSRPGKDTDSKAESCRAPEQSASVGAGRESAGNCAITPHQGISP